MSDASEPAFSFQKLHFSKRNIYQGEICPVLFLACFMPCVCESHETKNTFDSKKLERPKSQSNTQAVQYLTFGNLDK